MQENQGEKQLRNILIQVLSEETRWDKLKKRMFGGGSTDPGGPRSTRRGGGEDKKGTIRGVPTTDPTAGKGARVAQVRGKGKFSKRGEGGLDQVDFDLVEDYIKELKEKGKSEVTLAGETFDLHDLLFAPDPLSPSTISQLRQLSQTAAVQVGDSYRAGRRDTADFWEGVLELAGRRIRKRTKPDDDDDIVDPPPPPPPPPGGEDGPIPIFKDIRDEEGNRLGAKAGGQGLQALLQPGEPWGLHPRGHSY